MNPAIFVAVPIRGADGAVIATDTVRYDQFVRKLLKAETEKEEAYHILAGIVGEIGEFYCASRVSHIKEELGDICFYTQAWLNHYNLTEADLAHINLDYMHAFQVLAELADVVKREYTYRKPRDHTKLLVASAYLIGLRNENLDQNILNLPDILQANAEKLCERYKNLTYSDSEAIARADKKPGE